MKLQNEVSDLVLANVSTTGEFKIRNSAKAFKILSDGLYSNKIRAIIRELSCNAIDSHVAAGKLDVPIEVHLPTVFESWFSVRDFGVGLNHEEVSSIYTTYFESTKTESNDFIGALGLGSKSPFSYTENFTVIAIKDGVKRIYSAFINQMGVPSVALMSEEETTDGNGVEVKFSVTARNDYYTFEHEAQSVFAWFKVTPTLSGKTTNIYPINYMEKDILPGIHRKQDRGNSYAVMGNISYPIRVNQETARELGDLSKLLDCSLVIDFNIGELDFTASREELSYIPLTVSSIKAKLEQLNSHLENHIEKKSQEFTCNWEKAEYFYSQWSDQLYSAAVKSYTKRINFKYVDEKEYYGRHKFTITSKDFKDYQILAFGHHRGTNATLKVGKIYDRVTREYDEAWEISLNRNVVVILNDLRVGCHARARSHWIRDTGQNRNGQNVFCISMPQEKDDAKKKKLLKEFQEKHLPECPNVIWASTLPVPPSRAKSALNGVLEYRINGYGEATWVESDLKNTDDIDENETYYYVNLSNFQPMTKDRSTQLGFLDTVMSDLYKVFSGKMPFKLYGVRKGVEDQIKDLDNFVWFEDKVKEVVSKISQEEVKSAYAVSGFNHKSAEFFEELLKLPIDQKSPIWKFAKKYEKACKNAKYGSQSSTQRAGCLSRLTDMYGKSISVDGIKAEVEDDIERIEKVYPMLQYVYGSHYTYEKSHVIEYITLIDKQEK